MEVIYFNPRSYKRSDVSQQIDTSTPYDFNPRSYKRSDSHTIYFPYKIYYFNPRSYKRSDVVRAKEHNVCSEFQSTLLQEERPATPVAVLCIDLFQSTLLQEERPPSSVLSAYFSNFNPRSYKRSDGISEVQAVVYCIISIHAPTRGATRRPDTVFVDIDHFNPRSYKRSDSICSIFSAIYCISIHAPTRGATLSLFLHRRQI